MQVKPVKNRLIVFSVPVRRKMPGTGLYKGNPNRWAFNRAEEIWVLSCGDECKEKFNRGDHGWINDSFELEPTDVNLWNDFKYCEEFQKLNAFVQSVDGEVKTSIVSENSLLCIDNEYEIEEKNHGVVDEW